MAPKDGAPKAPSACQAMDGAGRCLHFGEVDGSLCAIVSCRLAMEMHFQDTVAFIIY